LRASLRATPCFFTTWKIDSAPGESRLIDQRFLFDDEKARY